MRWARLLGITSCPELLSNSLVQYLGKNTGILSSLLGFRALYVGCRSSSCHLIYSVHVVGTCRRPPRVSRCLRAMSYPYPTSPKLERSLFLPPRMQRLREAAASRSFHLKNTGVLRDLAFEPYTFVGSAVARASASGSGTSSGGVEGGNGGGDGGGEEEGWDDWGDDDNAQEVRSGE